MLTVYSVVSVVKTAVKQLICICYTI